MIAKRMGTCYICRESKFITRHHIIPQRYHPPKNNTVGICVTCHEFINDIETSESLEVQRLGNEVKTLNENIRVKNTELTRLRAIIENMKRLLET